jgi:hypothetical protein
MRPPVAASSTGDLRRVGVKTLGQLGQRLLALNGGQSHLRLERRRVVPAATLNLMLVSSTRGARHRLNEQRFHLSELFRSPGSALSSRPPA